MAESINLAELTKRLMCGICLNTVYNPKRLVCNHSFCKECLDKILDFAADGSAHIKCPNGCQDKTTISHLQTTNNLHIDYMFKSILDLAPKLDNDGAEIVKSTCATCTRAVTKYCTQCRVFKCGQCVDDHDGVLDSFVSVDFHRGRNDVVFVCDEHSTEAMHMCCETRFVCIYCIHRGHKFHKYESLDQLEKTLKGLLSEKIDSNSDFEKRWEEAKKDIQDVERSLNKALKLKKLKRLSDYIEYLDSEEEKVKEEFNSISTNFLAAFDSLSYFQECLPKEGWHFLSQRNEIMKKTKTEHIENRKTIPGVAVCLEEGNSTSRHLPLGSVNAVQCSNASCKRFRSKIDSVRATPSVSSLQSLKDLVKNFTEEVNTNESFLSNENQIEMEEVEMEEVSEHRCHLEGICTFDVKNVSKIKGEVLSQPVVIQNLPWRIMLMPRYTTGESGEMVKSAGIWVQCVPEGDVPAWSCQAQGEITLKNRKGDDFTRKIRHVFNKEENDHGYSAFLPWVDILDANNGYNEDDSIRIEAVIQAEVPKKSKDQKPALTEEQKKERCDNANAAVKRITADNAETSIGERLAELEKELKRTLSVKGADHNKCIKVLQDIADLPLTPVLLIRNKTIIPTLKKVKAYKASQKVCENAAQLYYHFKGMFVGGWGDQWCDDM